MPMTRDEHEALLNDLNSPELEHTRRSEILQQLRADYTSVHSDFENLENSNAKFKADNDDLVHANSKLFRELGIVGQGKEKTEEQEKKTFSESVTLEQLERGAE